MTLMILLMITLLLYGGIRKLLEVAEDLLLYQRSHLSIIAVNVENPRSQSVYKVWSSNVHGRRLHHSPLVVFLRSVFRCLIA
ncbi:hypothetical protein C5H24_12610 [Xylella fastidiosa]|nr:hypothetical protein C5H24_12610 [Xylella fastidiosa]